MTVLLSTFEVVCGPVQVALGSVADVAGAGMFTKLLTAFGPAKMHAVEPNDDMRSHGA